MHVEQDAHAMNQTLEHDETLGPDERLLEAERQYLGVELNDPEPPLRHIALKTTIVLALLTLFLLDIRYASIYNVTPLYVVVIFLSLGIQRARWVLGVTVATIALNLIALRWDWMHMHPWKTNLALNHILMVLFAQVPVGILAFRALADQRRRERDRNNAVRRQRDLYERERAARSAEQAARLREGVATEELRLRAEDLQKIIESERMARKREKEAQEREKEARGERDYLRVLQERFQRILLPMVPSRAANGRLALGPLYQPAIQEMQMGGDFYDAMTLPNGMVGLVIGDVAGHGVEAAAQTAFVTTTLRAFATEDPLSPGRVLARVNRSLTLDRKFSVFVSVFYGVYDPATSKLRYANAGHEPPIIIHPDEQYEPLDSTGLVVGVDSSATYDECEIVFNTGDCLILFTDGITEARKANTGELLGWDGVAKIAVDHREVMMRHNADPSTASQISPDDLAHALYQEALAYTGVEPVGEAVIGGGLTDDVALLVVVALAGDQSDFDKPVKQDTGPMALDIREARSEAIIQTAALTREPLTT